MPLSKDFKFPTFPAVQEEAERRAVLMFGESWRDVCEVARDRFNNDAISNGDMMLSFSAKMVLSWASQRRNDLSDGYPARIAYYSNGNVHYTGHFRDDAVCDTEDGGPAQVRYSELGEVLKGHSSVHGHLSADESINMIKAAQFNRVAALLAKADQAVIPVGIPL